MPNQKYVFQVQWTLRSEKEMDQLRALTGFEALIDKRIAFEKEDGRWLGFHLKWDGVDLNICKPAHDNRLESTNRGVYVTAGGFTTITESVGETLAVGHANVMRKVAGRQSEWIRPLITKLAEAVLYHYERAKHYWEAVGEANVLRRSGDSNNSKRRVAFRIRLRLSRWINRERHYKSGLRDDRRSHQYVNSSAGELPTVTKHFQKYKPFKHLG